MTGENETGKMPFSRDARRVTPPGVAVGSGIEDVR
jgi:hypothetical protein